MFLFFGDYRGFGGRIIPKGAWVNDADNAMVTDSGNPIIFT